MFIRQEQLLLDPMFIVPGSDIRSVHITADYVRGNSKPIYSRSSDDDTSATTDSSTTETTDSEPSNDNDKNFEDSEKVRLKQ